MPKIKLFYQNKNKNLVFSSNLNKKKSTPGMAKTRTCPHLQKIKIPQTPKSNKIALQLYKNVTDLTKLI